jgi:hypothetical protein
MWSIQHQEAVEVAVRNRSTTGTTLLGPALPGPAHLALTRG